MDLRIETEVTVVEKKDPSQSLSVMARPTWLIDGKRIATKIKSASETSDPKKVKWKSNPTRTCPKCDHVIDNNDVTQDWPGLPRGVKFDPTDQELLWHLFAKAGVRDAKRHPFIDEFIPTVDNEDGICYTHPKKLPGVKQDGSATHFFYRTMKAYNTGSRKRRKIQNDDGRVRWHKTGKTKPVIMDGVHMGQKKIMVLYMSNKGEKDEKTNWVMHQIHIGTEEDEKDGEFVVSKVLHQQQTKQCDRNEHDLQQNQRPSLVKPDPPTPASAVPNPPRSKEHANVDLNQEGKSNCEESVSKIVPDPETENKENAETRQPECEKPNDHDSQTISDLKWSEGDVQFLLDSQQLADGMFLCDEILLSQSSYGGEEGRREKPCLSDYATIGAEHLKKDLEDCQNLSQFDLSNIELDTPPDLRLSQLLGSQESLFS